MDETAGRTDGPATVAGAGRPDLLLIGPLPEALVRDLERDFTPHRYFDAPDRAGLLAGLADRLRFAATVGHHGCSKALIDALPRLEIVASVGVGTDALDLEAARRRGVRVTNTPDVLDDAVAELTLGLMLALCRRIPEGDAFVRGGRWPGGAFELTGELAGSRAGILGLGRIGKAIARRLEAFRVDVAYHGRTPQPDVPLRYYADLAAMAAAVDWLVVIAPASPQTDRIVGRRVMEALGPGGRLVNVARGSLVDEPAMIELLGTGRLGGAALDVFADEPNVPEALRALSNVVLSPHQGSATRATRAAMGALAAANLRAHLVGAPLPTPVV